MCGISTISRRSPERTSWTTRVTSGLATPKIYVVQTLPQGYRALHPDGHRPRRSRARSHLRFRHHSLRRRAMGPPLDHHRHVSRGAGTGSRPNHGSALSVLPARRLREGQIKEAEVTHASSPNLQPHGNIRQGFVYERVPHITLKSIANNAEIDVIWEKYQTTLEPLREQLNAALKKSWQEWEIPREADAKWPEPREEPARRLVAAAHRPSEGDRRLHRRQGRIRKPLRQALRGQEKGPRRRTVHGRKPLAASRARG